MRGRAPAPAARWLMARQRPARNGRREEPPGRSSPDAGCRPSTAGLRSQDVVRDPERMPRVPQPADAVEPSRGVAGGYLPGSVIVKFKAGADRTAAVTARMAQVSAASAERPSYADFEIVTIARRRRSGAVAAELRGAARRASTRSRAICNHTMLPAERPALCEPVELPGARHGARVGYPARRRPPTSSSRCSTPASRSGTPRSATRSTFLVPADAGRPDLSAAGRRRRALRDRARARRRRVRVAARFHLERQRPGRSRRPRHPRLGHRRPTHQQRRRRRRHGLQRAHHAGEGDRRDVGSASSTRPTTAPTMSWRAASATPPTTARKVINMSLGREAGGPGPGRRRRHPLRGAARGAFVAIAAGNSREQGNQPNVIGNIAPVAGRRGRRWAPSAVRSTSRSTRPRRRPSSCPRRAATSGRRAAPRAASCSRRSTSICCETYNRRPVAVRPAAGRLVRLLLLPGHVDGHPARVRLRGAP